MAEKLPGALAKSLMQNLSDWGNLTTIIVHGGCVFEFKGVFPEGEENLGYYNLHSGGANSNTSRFEGHINLDKIDHIVFQDSLHRGKESYAFVFNSKELECIFKVFLGRDKQGELLPEQVARFKAIQVDFNQLVDGLGE